MSAQWRRGGPGFQPPGMVTLVNAFFDKHLKGVAAHIKALPDSEVTVPPAANKAK